MWVLAAAPTVLAALVALTACQGPPSTLPGAPTNLVASAGNARVSIAFSAPVHSGQSVVSTYVARCSAGPEHFSGLATASPVVVSGLRNGTLYACTVAASNSAGAGAASASVAATPVADASSSLAAGYRQAHWAMGISVTYPSECSMTIWSDGTPNHRIDSAYLEPPSKPGAKIVATTPLSGMKLVAAPYAGSKGREPMSFNICPTRAANTTATGGGTIGILVSGASLFAATEIAGHRATALGDNTTGRYQDAQGNASIARFIDACNGHPTPASAGGAYHYHGHSRCVTAQVDQAGGPSHLIGVALDGYPIYGDRDINGQPVRSAQLDVCNGINSPTPEFPGGVYHYVLQAGVKSHDSAMRCYAGTVSAAQSAAAQAIGYCYTAEPGAGAAAKMPMPGSASRRP
jgi:YHYH protein/Fibronectin type III domain